MGPGGMVFFEKSNFGQEMGMAGIEIARDDSLNIPQQLVFAREEAGYLRERVEN